MEIDADGRVRQTTKSRREAVREHVNCTYSSPRTFQRTSIYMLDTHIDRIYNSYEKNGKGGKITKDEIRKVVIDHTMIYISEMK